MIISALFQTQSAKTQSVSFPVFLTTMAAIALVRYWAIKT